MRFLDTKAVFAVCALANLCLAVIPIIVVFIGETTHTVVALNVGLIALAITAFAATAFLFVRNEQQMSFLKVMAVSSSNTVASSVT
jgi:hypothetical protein